MTESTDFVPYPFDNGLDGNALKAFFVWCAKQNVSDIHIQGGNHLVVSHHGRLRRASTGFVALTAAKPCHRHLKILLRYHCYTALSKNQKRKDTMKKAFIAVLVAGLSFGALAQHTGHFAQGYAQGGFKDSTSGRDSVAQTKALRDNAWVILEGNIIKQTEHERYEFRDATGSIDVEIDDELWLGQRAAPSDKVRIEGEVDHDWNRVEIDVKSLQVLK